MSDIEVTDAQRKRCTKCKHSAIMRKNKEKGIHIYVCGAQILKYQKCKHKEAIRNYWELVLEALYKKFAKEKEK